jgi:hypothetical protein
VGPGELGDEVEALVFVLNATPEAKQRLAFGRDWERIAALPSYRAIVENGEVLDEIERFRRGELSALYRMQKHPLILKFVAEPEVRKMLPKIRASTLARELERIERSGAETDPRVTEGREN